MGSQGQSPRQGLGAVAPRSAPAWMPGVYAKGLCKDAKPTKHTQPFTGERGLGIRQGCRDRTPKGFMQGRIQVVEQSRCRTHRQQTTTIAQMQSQQSIHSPSPRGRGLGLGKDAEIERPKALQDAKPTKRSYRDREFALSYKKQTFSTS